MIVDFNEGDQGQYCTVIISLMQKYTRARTVKGEQVPDGVGFLVFKVTITVTTSANSISRFERATTHPKRQESSTEELRQKYLTQV